ncbi:MAG: Excinuclease ABC subunit B, partial [uncultured Gemmatimonadaceae bacterium]
ARDEVRPHRAVQPRRRPAQGDRGADRGAAPRRPLPDAPRRHRLGQDDDDGQRHRAAGQAGARALAQQDARGAALRGAQELLPAERGRVLHLVLRLLPARGVRAEHRHVHREGRVDQRGHRPPPAARHVEPHGALGRDHRLDGLGDLRARRPRVVQVEHGDARGGAEDPARRHPALARAHPVQPQRRRLRARHVPGARRHGGDLPGVRGAGGARRAVGRRDRAHLQDQRRHRGDDHHPRAVGDLPGQALHHRAAVARARRGVDPAGAGRAARGAAARGEAARGAAAREPDELRRRDDARDRHVRRDRELLAPALGAQRGRATRLPLRLLPRGLPRRHRRVARHAAADPRHVQRRPRAQAHARRLRLPAAERARQPAAHLRRVPRAHAAGDLRVRDAGGAGAGAVRGRGGRAGDPAHGARGPRDRGAPGARPGGRPARRDPQAREGRRARAGHHAHEAHERGPHRLPAAGGRARAVHALRHRRDRAGRDRARAAARRLRRADRHQPAARGARHARGVARRDPRRRPGGVPPLRPLADPDRRARRAPRARPRDLLRRPRHRVDAAVHGGDGAPPDHPDRVQRGARDRPAQRREERGPGALHHPRGRRPRGEGGRAQGPPRRRADAGLRRRRGRPREARRAAREGDEGGGGVARLRGRRADPRPAVRAAREGRRAGQARRRRGRGPL